MGLPDFLAKEAIQLAADTTAGKAAIAGFRRLADEGLERIGLRAISPTTLPAPDILAQDLGSIRPTVHGTLLGGRDFTTPVIDILDRTPIDRQSLGIGKQFDPSAPLRWPLLAQKADTIVPVVRAMVTDTQWLQEYHSGSLAFARFPSAFNDFQTALTQAGIRVPSDLFDEAAVRDALTNRPDLLTQYAGVLKAADRVDATQDAYALSHARLGVGFNQAKAPWLAPSTFRAVPQQLGTAEGAYLRGTGQVILIPPTHESQVSVRALVNKLAHESEHQEQDQVVLYHMADQIGIGTRSQASEQQLSALSSMYKDEIGGQLQRPWAIAVLAQRGGRALTSPEGARAVELIRASQVTPTVVNQTFKDAEVSARLNRDVELWQRIATRDLLKEAHKNPGILQSDLKDVALQLPNPNTVAWTVSQDQAAAKSLAEAAQRIQARDVAREQQSHAAYMGLYHEREAWATGRLYSDMLKQDEPIFSQAWHRAK